MLLRLAYCPEQDRTRIILLVMSLQITRCPECGSSFNITAAILNMLDGKVRCGACLAVFNARDTLAVPGQQEAGQSQESVFIGSPPEDFVDVAVFLDRNGGTEPDRDSGLQNDKEPVG